MAAHVCCVDSFVVPPVVAFSAPFPSPVPFLDPEKESLEWSPSQSSTLYKIDKWGAPYFSVNSGGNISIRPYGIDTKAHEEIDLLQIVKRVSGPKTSGGLGLQLPLIIRLPDILNNRLNDLQSAFEVAIKTQGYKLHYQGVYPVKSNQDRYVVEDIVRFGKSFHFGLEAGSKAELLLCMSCLCKGSSEALLICNGFKDVEYISLALIARKLALNTVIVLEQEEELDSVIELSKMLSVNKYVIGLRVKLQTMHSGHFGATSGENSKFGLDVTQILRIVKKLEQAGMLDCLQLLHFHIGSQIPSTYLLADALNEAAQIYCELVHLGAQMKVIDIGGGLGIDYDGSESAQSKFSVEYGLDKYALVVVQTIKKICDRESVNHPVICSESGRAIVSHHSVLIFEAVSASVEQTTDTPSFGLQHLVEALTDEGRAGYINLEAATKRADYNACSIYADQLKRHCVNQFKDGSLCIKHLAAIDGLCKFYLKRDIKYDPVRMYKINLSIFTSIPDFWGIDHLFPIIPIHRLKQRPITKGILYDLTCDSDGKIHTFIGDKSSLPLHETKDLCGDRGKYYLGMFLGGAYQEALGGLHNLFGRPSVVRVSKTDAPHGFEVEHSVAGMSCAEVLKVMQYEPELMLQTLKDRGKECEYGDHMVDVAGIVNTLSRSFHNMPYLVAG